MLRLHHHVIRRSPGRLDSSAVLALDPTKSFGNVGHEAILEGLQSISPGVRPYNYIKDFLSDATAITHVGDPVTPILSVGGRGTPQGAVLSPLLFNLATFEITKRIEKIPGLYHNLYADVITLLDTRGSDAQIGEILQIGIDIATEEAGRARLSCSPSKSELLLLSSPAQ